MTTPDVEQTAGITSNDITELEKLMINPDVMEKLLKEETIVTGVPQSSKTESIGQVNEYIPVNVDVQELQYRIGLQMEALKNIENGELRAKKARTLSDHLVDALGELSELTSGAVQVDETEEGKESDEYPDEKMTGKNNDFMPDVTMPEVREGMQWIEMINKMPFEFNFNGRYETPSYKSRRPIPPYPGYSTPVGYPQTPSMYYYPPQAPMPWMYPMGGMQQYPPSWYQQSHPGSQRPMSSHANPLPNHVYMPPNQYPIPGRYPMGGRQQSPNTLKNE